MADKEFVDKAKSVIADTSGRFKNKDEMGIPPEVINRYANLYKNNKPKIQEYLSGFNEIKPEDVSRSSWGNAGAGVLGFLSGMGKQTAETKIPIGKEYEVRQQRKDDFNIYKFYEDKFSKSDLAKLYAGTEKSYQILKRLGDKDTKAASIAMVFDFMKSLDPASVVRESEYKLGSGAGNLFEKLQGMVRDWQGKSMPPNIRKDFIDTAKTVLGAVTERYDSESKRYKNIVKKFAPTITDEDLSDFAKSSLNLANEPNYDQSKAVQSTAQNMPTDDEINNAIAVSNNPKATDAEKAAALIILERVK